VFAILDEEAGLEVVAGGDPIIGGGVLEGGGGDQLVGGGPGHADLAGFFDEDEPGFVADVAGLIWEHEGIPGRDDFGSAWAT